MFLSLASLFLAATATVSAQSSYGSGSASTPFPPFSGDPFQKYTLSANGIEASFIPYGARITSLLVKDKNGAMQDVVLGYDTGEQYLNDTETVHTYFGPVVGRYANRIKNGTFTINGVTSNIPENEHGGEDTLHGGSIGYDQQNWTVAAQSGNSITFMFYDAGQQGFPGDILNVATYTLTDDASWIARLVSIPFNEATPIMLANHVYWNLGAFVNEDALTILNNTLYMPYADRIIDIDGIEVPTGGINITNGTAYDFTKLPAKTMGQDILSTINACGTNCTGYDNAFILDRPRYSQPDDPQLAVLQMYSPVTGIQMTLSSNQQGIQIYTCDNIANNGSIAAKQDQQQIAGQTVGYGKFGCVVIETQDWIDAINYPEWGRDQWQIFTPTTEPYVNYQKYQFNVVN